MYVYIYTHIYAHTDIKIHIDTHTMGSFICLCSNHLIWFGSLYVPDQDDTLHVSCEILEAGSLITMMLV